MSKCTSVVESVSEGLARLLRRGPKFTVNTGEFATSAELITALEVADLAYFCGHVKGRLLPKINLSQAKGPAESYRVTPGDLAKTGTTRRGEFYVETVNLGFGQPVEEYGALLALKLDRQLKETGDSDLAIGEQFVIGSKSMVGSFGFLYLLCVSREVDGIELRSCFSDPDEKGDPDPQFLLSYK